MINETCHGCNTARALEGSTRCRACGPVPTALPTPAIEVRRDMIPAWQNALAGRWDHAADGTGPASLSAGASYVDFLIGQAEFQMERDPAIDRIPYTKEWILEQLGDQQNTDDCWRALVTLRGEAGQLQRLAERAGL